MIQAKILEIVDRGTCIPAIAVKVVNLRALDPERHSWLLGHAGWGSSDNPGVYLFHAGAPTRVAYDPYSYGDRTWQTAHRYIQGHFDEIEDGACIDVCQILGEPPHGTDYPN